MDDDTRREDEWRTRIDRRLADAPRYRALLTEGLFVEPGSALAGDRRVFSLLPTGTLAWTGLSTALEHVVAVERLWVSLDRNPAPRAYSSLLRPALVGAAQAYWLTDPGRRDERLERTRRLALYSLKREMEVLTDYRNVVDLHPEYPGGRSDLEHDLTVARARSAKVRASLPSSARGFALTEVIRAVADELYRDDPIRRLGVLLLWRLSSGDAHALPWPQLHRDGWRERIQPGDDTDPPDTVRLRDETTVRDLGVKVLAVAQMLDEALKLYDLRRRKHY